MTGAGLEYWQGMEREGRERMEVGGMERGGKSVKGEREREGDFLNFGWQLNFNVWKIVLWEEKKLLLSFKNGVNPLLFFFECPWLCE